MVMTFEQKVKKGIKHYSISALLDALQENGYDLKNVRFVSNRIPISTASVIQDIRFKSTSKIEVELNVGFLSTANPHNEALLKLLDTAESDYGHPFEPIVLIADQMLNKEYVDCVSGRGHDTLDQMSRLQFERLNMRVESTLFWFLNKVFPEFKLKIKKRYEPIKQAKPVVLGYSQMLPHKVDQMTIFDVEMVLSDSIFETYHLPSLESRVEKLEKWVDLKDVSLDIKVLDYRFKSIAKISKTSSLGFNTPLSIQKKPNVIQLFRTRQALGVG